MRKQLLLTGAAGFIGSHVAELLLSRGDSVIGVDNLNDYYDPARKQQNLNEITQRELAPGQFTFRQGDIRDIPFLNALFAEYQIDGIINLAAMAGVRVSIEDPHLYFDVNLVGTLNLLNVARDHRVSTFVQASTSSVYGDTEQIPFVETDLCDRPLAPYPASKRAAEMIGFTYHHLYKINFTALRFFTVYGPRGRPDMMAYKVLNNIFFGEPVPIFNAGQMYRDWTFVTDIAAGIVAAADQPLGFEVINLGRGEPVLLADFVRLIENLTGRPANLVPSPMMDADIPYTYANIEKAKRLLGYTPNVSVGEGVTRFWEWYQLTVLKA
ncbi:MAG: GDP-mannose 4,6-dehydratase [Chloroflexi bacterium]|nr:GDP-mannose 4,6-dehydratase [Chloroflexota bacterium]